MREGDELVFPRMSEQRPGAIPGDVRLRLKQEGGGSTGGGGGGGSNVGRASPPRTPAHRPAARLKPRRHVVM